MASVHEKGVPYVLTEEEKAEAVVQVGRIREALQLEGPSREIILEMSIRLLATTCGSKGRLISALRALYHADGTLRWVRGLLVVALVELEESIMRLGDGSNRRSVDVRS